MSGSKNLKKGADNREGRQKRNHLAVILAVLAIASVLLCALSGSPDSVAYKVGEALLTLGMAVFAIGMYFKKGKIAVRLIETAVYLAAITLVGIKMYRSIGETSPFPFIILTQVIALLIVGVHTLIERIVKKIKGKKAGENRP